MNMAIAAYQLNLVRRNSRSDIAENNKLIQEGKLSPERLDQHSTDLSCLVSGDNLSSFSDYTNGIMIGEGTYHNTPCQGLQLGFALSLSNNPLVEKILEENLGKKGAIKKITREQAKELVKTRVLEGIKLIDLGCGEYPLFARIAKRLGAEVYTADFIPSKELKIDSESVHIHVDFGNSGASRSIADIAGKDLDLVTQAHLESDGFYGAPRIAYDLLKVGGFYYAPAKGITNSLYRKAK